MAAGELGEDLVFQDHLRSLISDVVALRLIGIASRDLRSRSNPWRARLFLFAVGALAIICLLVAVLGEHPLVRVNRLLGWCIWYIVVAPVIAWGLHVAVKVYGSAAQSTDAVLTDDGRSAFYLWFARYLNWRPQVAAASSVALLGPLILWLGSLSSGVSSKVVIDWPSYLVLAFTGYLVGASGYWILTSFLLIDLWSRPGNMRLLTFGPARTAGIEDLARIAGGSFAACAGYIIYLLYPFTVWLGSVPGVDTALGELLVSLVKVVTLGLSTAIIVLGGMLPQISLSRAVRRVRRERMLGLAWQAEQGRLEARQEYELVAGSPTSTVGSGNVVQIAAGMAAALAPALLVLFG